MPSDDQKREDSRSEAEAQQPGQESSPEGRGETSPEPREASPEQKEIEALHAEIESLQAAHHRLAADFENYKRHSRREAEGARQLGRDRLVRNLSSVLGELGSAGRAEGEDAASLRHGIQIIRQKIDSVLDDVGYERIETVGRPMDPNLHEAVAVIPAQTEEQRGQVVEEITPGYRRGEVLVQPARVVVAR